MPSEAAEVLVHVPTPDNQWHAVSVKDRFGYDVCVIHGPHGIEVRQETARTEDDVTPMNFQVRTAPGASERRIRIILTNVAGTPRTYSRKAVAYVGPCSKEEATELLTGVRMYLRAISNGLWDVDSFVIAG